MTLHSHKVDDSTYANDCEIPVHVPAGWKIAAGDADDERVIGAHPWQSDFLVFDDGYAFGTAMCFNPAHRGTYDISDAKFNQFFLTPEYRQKTAGNLTGRLAEA